MTTKVRNPLAIQLALASLVSILALCVVCGVGIQSLRQQSGLSGSALRGELHLFEETTAVQALLYQKGFVTSYMLTRDRSWLAELERGRALFNHWLARAQSVETDTETQKLLAKLAAEYAIYDSARQATVALFDAGQTTQANASLKGMYTDITSLLATCEEFNKLGRRRAQRGLQVAHRTMTQRIWLLLSASVAGTLASLIMGFLLARRIAKPIYELQLQVESAVHKTRLSVPQGRVGIGELGEHMGTLLRKIEETDAAIVEQRQRLIQSEKLSAIGEVTAKLAHEILNPLAGMKAAVQLFLRTQSPEQLTPESLRETALALDQEISRVDQLVRRLVNYARPLAPRTQSCAVTALLATAVDAARGEISRAGATLEQELEPGLPDLEVDPLLIEQALVNLLVNAAQSSPAGGRITLSARRAEHLGQPQIAVVITDEGAGISAEHLPRIFMPFFTTKPKGHGLGLAITQNIVMEHGGHLTARNRTDRSGAVFEMLLPLAR